MHKIWQIARKDLLLIFRDPMALVFYLLAPFLLTLGMAAITGAFNSGDSGLSNIPLVITNADQAQLGNGLVDVFQSEDLDSLINPILDNDFEDAKSLVDEREAMAALLIPAGFSNSIIPQSGQSPSEEVIQLELYTDGESTYSIGVVRTIIQTFLSELESSSASYSVAISKMLSEGLISLEELPTIMASLSTGMEAGSSTGSNYEIVSSNKTFESKNVSYLAMIAPGMALMFLMYNVSAGGVSFLIERRNYTLQRNLVSPTQNFQIIFGKSMVIFLRGFAQVLILVLTSSLLFKLYWGKWLAVLVLIALRCLWCFGLGNVPHQLPENACPGFECRQRHWFAFWFAGGGFLPITTYQSG